MTEQDATLEFFRRWIAEQRLIFEPLGVEFDADEFLESAGTDPIAWVNMYNDDRLAGARLSLWRGGDMELELADLETCEVFEITRFSAEVEFNSKAATLTSWITKGVK